MSIYLNQLGIICALGNGIDDVRRALFADVPGGVAPTACLGKTLYLGVVNSELASQDTLPAKLHSRNNALLLTALEQIRPEVDAAIARFGAERIGLVLGTSTSGIGEAQAAIAEYQASGQLAEGFHMAQQELGSPAAALSTLLGLAGPVMVISTACSSSAKAMASAARLLNAGMCDVVICGGVDSLCDFTVAGFSALESVSAERCQPMSIHRSGINIGEGAALFLMSKAPGPVALLGWGESSDAHHISAPAPDGKGASTAMQEALQRAALQPADIGYINLHGTATPQNDAMESLAIGKLFGSDTPCSSTKPLTGHTLGAAGAIEAAICWLTLSGNPTGQLPPHWWDGASDPAMPPLALVKPGQCTETPLQYTLSNSFAFGGSNAVLIFGKNHAAD
ncbi:beta-ketoacyl-ACP synthase [Iodobacter fluviatilis]|uniref:3-oxoacyl-[acyl-carrier-protein] synthase 2 n=1 Tax=Iodobacter fluviatilis TaxID=537 RepID=A0A377Q9G1_9NEIS|nr:beta-ketoacyl-ACP synthase [Iodobacter fluviatilis]TCU88591.1 3-oxoacyl-[acyl-carrier-protein] synthase-1 [Iodobacter fluviatilis]STQ91338.1 3-oxoacyl-[acyl-carrier-protein] synthase 2 [Iodobacter fluviatilis]